MSITFRKTLFKKFQQYVQAFIHHLNDFFFNSHALWQPLENDETPSYVSVPCWQAWEKKNYLYATYSTYQNIKIKNQSNYLSNTKLILTLYNYGSLQQCRQCGTLNQVWEPMLVICNDKVNEDRNQNTIILLLLQIKDLETVSRKIIKNILNTLWILWGVKRNWILNN